ncbi:tetratricopeptide repeat protein [Bacteriovorax sp. BSW11_IV]|uniref:tetratricopeptide repeat protein n=1 Tax=Bacteriovorax sp. BSW11_IV TaxID=1353529 RepID=UPI000389F556|nr:tetratricopeptide repeat protein [Bacteriovorax sp. BSW11_IV]EQC48378.1 tetratricopeptide repeat protein [Bacteriovorax sp. BSW11_IV]
MKKLLQVFLISFVLINSFSYADVGNRRQELLSIIDEELREVVRLANQNSKNPALMIRMAELWLEKARIVREDENMKYLQIEPARRKKINRRTFFKQSNSYFMQAQKICNNILKKFRNFPGKGDVYYILAYNAKEFQQDDKAMKYFQLAVQNSNLDSITSVKSYLALAEIYYNKSNYERALPLYEKALAKKNLRDKWWTKDSFNLAWTYFRLGQKSRAIETMEMVEKESKNSKYIDMSSQASRDLAIFYAESGSVKNAVASFSKTGGDVAKKLLSLGNYLESQAKYDTAEDIYEDALSKNPSTEVRNEVYIKLLSIYERFGKQDKHIAAVETLNVSFKKGELTPDQKEALDYHTKRNAAILQKQVVSNLYATRPKERTRRAELSVRYFTVFGQMNPAKAAEASFLSAETLYAIGDYDAAIKLYEVAKNDAEKTNNKKIAIKASQGMLASLSKEGVSKQTKDSYLAPALEAYLVTDPASKKSMDAYEKLFATYMDTKQVDKAEDVLIRFRKNIPAASVKQEAMLAEVMDYYKKAGNRDGIGKWVARIKARQFAVSPKYAKQVNLLLLTMQFEGVKQATDSGDQVKALRIYFEVYKSPESSEEAKKKAAYNMAVYFNKLSDAERSYKWMERALYHMSTKDVQQFEDSILVTSRDLFNQRRVEHSADIAQKAFDKLCSVKAKNKNLFFKNSIVMNLADKKLKEAEAMIDKGTRCGVPNANVEEMKLEYLSSLYEEKRWSKYEEIINELDRVDYLQPKVSGHFVKLYDVYKDNGRVAEANRVKNSIIRTFNNSRRKAQFPVETLDIIAIDQLERLQGTFNSFKNMRLTFPEDVYNNLLKRKFTMLNDLTERTLKIFELRSGKGMVSAYKLLVEAYEAFGNEVRDFTPPGKNEEYVKSFKGSMESIATPILQKAASLRKEATSKIMNYTVLASDNGFFLNSGVDNVTEFKPLKGPVIMDRGGRK